jgi:hypothetical protein
MTHIAPFFNFLATAGLNSGAKCNGAMQTGFARLCKLFEDRLERGLEAQALSGREMAVTTMSWISSSDTWSMSI